MDIQDGTQCGIGNHPVEPHSISHQVSCGTQFDHWQQGERSQRSDFSITRIDLVALPFEHESQPYPFSEDVIPFEIDKRSCRGTTAQIPVSYTHLTLPTSD